ncbi:MAG: type III PLP-dependent enzyme [Alphaproteobacteria bacterium]|nr:type III PLP-dependent enzyme [Alphaproteobacteria bacterium]
MLTDRGVKARKRHFDSQDVTDDRPAKALTRLREVARKADLPAERGGLPPRIARYLETASVQTPCLIVDVELVEHNYVDLVRALPEASVFYAVKANPADEVVKRLAKLGANFDTASLGEIDLCLAHGVEPERLSFGNTIKKQKDIAAAYDRGVRLFAFDSEAELIKLSQSAPGAKVFCRILVDCSGAEWPLSRKFGCEMAMAADLLVRAKELGLDPYGLSFHVGSQQTDLAQFDKAIAQASALFAAVAARGVHLRMINVGGGFPSRYHRDVPPIISYGQAIRGALKRHYKGAQPELIVEPGRYIVGDAGVIASEVVLVAHKGGADERRWVYLDVGKFHGLAETMDEAIKYRLITPHDGGETVPVVLAGPTCDSADILYEKTDYRLPAALKAGDRILILSTGAYTTTYSSIAFNGMPPLAQVCI